MTTGRKMRSLCPSKVMPVRNQGFSLLEVLVAVVMLSVVVGAVMQLFSGGLQGLGRAEKSARASFVADSQLARLGLEEPLEEGDSTGKFDDLFRWQVHIKNVSDDLLASSEQPTTAFLPVQLFQVDVTVLWQDGKRKMQLKRTTLRIEGKDATR